MRDGADSPGVPVRHSHRTHREDGFTIVEVLVAVFVLLVGVLGTVTLVENGLSSC